MICDNLTEILWCLPAYVEIKNSRFCARKDFLIPFFLQLYYNTG